MHVKELIEQLKKEDPDNIVCIPVIKAFPSYGPTLFAHIKFVSSGFDWDMRKSFINTEETVYADLDQFKMDSQFSRCVRNTIYMLKNDKSRQKNANAVKRIKEHIARFYPKDLKKAKNKSPE